MSGSGACRDNWDRGFDKDGDYDRPSQPAEDERVKEAHARDVAQEIVIESSKAAGYADSTWLDGNFKHELANRITAALLPVQPAASTEANE